MRSLGVISTNGPPRGPREQGTVGPLEGGVGHVRELLRSRRRLSEGQTPAEPQGRASDSQSEGSGGSLEQATGSSVEKPAGRAARNLRDPVGNLRDRREAAAARPATRSCGGSCGRSWECGDGDEF